MTDPEPPRATSSVPKLGAALPPRAENGPEPERAGFGIRLLAALIDATLMTAVQLLLATVMSENGAIALGIAIDAAYTILMPAGRHRGTFGKYWLGLEIRALDGEAPIALGTSVLRYLGEIASSLLLGIGYLMILFRADRRGLHDLIAGTVVVRTR
jgi:uncharacterized RDD family membrane protein YckC